MALQSSGTIKMSEINTELGRTSTTANTSLAAQSNGTYATINTANASSDRPNGSSPHSMSEFYSYNHSASSLSSITIKYNSEDSSEACSAELTLTYYHDGSGETPTEGDTLYSNSSGTTTASSGYYVFGDSNAGTFVDDGDVTGETFTCAR